MDVSALIGGDANAFEQLCTLLMSSQNEQRSQVRLASGAVRGAQPGAAAANRRRVAAAPLGPQHHV